MIKAAFFDVDGTLLDHTDRKSIFPDSAAASLAALQRKGVKVFVSTGRGPAMLGDIRDLFPFDGFVTFNGQMVLERDGTVLHRMFHKPEDIRAIVPLAQAAEFPGFVHEEAESWPLCDTPEVRRHFQWLGKEMPGVYDVARAEKFPVVQVMLHEPPEPVVEVFGTAAQVEVVACGPGMVDVIPKGGGKETGLSAVIEHYGFKREETVAFGDGMNDLRMIKWAGTGVAMGNAEPEVKAAADYVTAPVWDDGVKKALLHLGMLAETDF